MKEVCRMEGIVVLIKEPKTEHRIAEIRNDLKKMQSIVGGYIEVIKVSKEGIVMVVNEEGKIYNLPHNIKINGQNIFGTVFFSKADGSEFTSLTNKDIAHIETLLHQK